MKSKIFVLVIPLIMIGVIMVNLVVSTGAVSPLSENELVQIQGGVNDKCKTTQSCSTLKKKYTQTNTCYKCDGSSTTAWCYPCAEGKNCTVTTEKFSCGQKLKCEDIDCTVMCGDVGACTFYKASADSDDC